MSSPTFLLNRHTISALGREFDSYMLMCVIIDKPQDDPNIRGDAFKTLIVARLSYDATEQDLESEFGRFGPIERVCISA